MIRICFEYVFSVLLIMCTHIILLGPTIETTVRQFWRDLERRACATPAVIAYILWAQLNECAELYFCRGCDQ